MTTVGRPDPGMAPALRSAAAADHAVALVSMPFVMNRRPSIQLGLLGAIASAQGFPVTTMDAHHGDVPAALAACDALSDGWEREHCWNGVFMENIPDGDDPAPSRYLRAGEPLYPCTAVEQRYRGQCYQKQTSYALQLRGGDVAAVFALCATVTDPARPDCYQGLGRNAVEDGLRRESDPASTCALGGDLEARSNCGYGVARYLALYHHDRAVADRFCAALPAELVPTCQRGAATYPRG